MELALVKPIHLEEIDRKNGDTDSPGNGIGPEHHPDILGQRNHDLDPDYPENTPAAHHNEHRHPAEARAPQDARHGVGIGHQGVGKDDVPGHQHAVADDLRVVVEEAHQLGGQ